MAKSADLNAAAVFLGMTFLLGWYSTYFGQYILRFMREIFAHQLKLATHISITSFDHLFQTWLYHILLMLMPFLLGLMAIGIAINLYQVRFLFTTQALKPHWSKLNPISGLQRLFKPHSLMNLPKGVAKMMAVGICGYWVIHNNHDHLFAMSQMQFMPACLLIWKVITDICWAIAMVMLIIGVIDMKYQKKHWIDQLKMTKQEVKDEHKNQEGDPKIKSKIRAMGQAIARQQIATAVPTADVIVTNPTHFAVAIQYDPDVCPAPRVVAKGTDHMAFYIRELAKTNNVPIVENKPLARSMYAMVEVGHMVPPELFVAVAEVLAFVFKKNRGRRRSAVKQMVDAGGRR